MKTTDLGHGWFANMHEDTGGMTIRNPDKGQRIDLTAESVATLKSIFKQAETHDEPEDCEDARDRALEEQGYSF
jgi:hypothetical protein